VPSREQLCSGGGQNTVPLGGRVQVIQNKYVSGSTKASCELAVTLLKPYAVGEAMILLKR